MATVFKIQDGGGRHLESWLLRFMTSPMRFKSKKQYNFGDDWSNIKQMATVFRKSKIGAVAILNYGYVDFLTSLCVLNQSCNIPTLWHFAFHFFLLNSYLKICIHGKDHKFIELLNRTIKRIKNLVSLNITKY